MHLILCYFLFVQILLCSEIMTHKRIQWLYCVIYIVCLTVAKVSSNSKLKYRNVMPRRVKSDAAGNNQGKMFRIFVALEGKSPQGFSSA